MQADDALRDLDLILPPGVAARLPSDAAAGLARRRARRRSAGPLGTLGIADRLLMKAGVAGYMRTLVPRDLDVLRRALDGDAGGVPRVLVRIDEFPHARAADEPARVGTERYRTFHEIMAEAGVPYLVALMPRVSHDYLDPRRRDDRGLDDGEIAMIRRLDEDGVAFGLHGLNHRTRHADPRRHSELSGLGDKALGALLDRALRTLEEHAGVAPRVFVAPFNRFDARQWPELAARFAVVTGGPESVRVMGLTPTPQWRGGAVYLPSYPPLYGSAEEAAGGTAALAARGAGVWAPVVLHWGGEQRDDWAGLRRAARILACHAVPWADLLTAVERTR